MAYILTPSRIISALGILIILEVVIVWYSGGAADVMALAQLICLPFVAVLLSRILLFGIRIPSALLVIVCGLALAGAVIRRGVQHVSEEVFLMARFDEDRLGGETSVARDRIRVLDGIKNPHFVGALEHRISSRQEAEARLAAEPHRAGVIYGSERSIEVVLRQGEPFSLKHSGSTPAAAGVLRDFNLPDLQIVTTVPSVSVSFVAQAGSIEYLARLAAIWGRGPTALIAADEDLHVESQLTRLNSIRSFWATPEPVVFGRFMLGTYYLTQALRGSTVGIGTIRCSNSLLMNAYSRLRMGEAGALKAAILNNIVVSDLVGYEGSMSRKQLLRESSRRLHRIFSESVFSDSAPFIASAIESNIKSINMALREGPDEQ
jgi:hypothetical protein